MKDAFDQVAGVPDFIGGSGVGIITYYFREDESEGITIRDTWNTIGYFVRNQDGSFDRMQLYPNDLN